MKYSYYPGCSLHGNAIDYQMSINAACEKLGMELVEIDNWNCCGATSAAAEGQKFALALGAMNLMKCEDEEVVASCNACYLRLSQVKVKFAQYPELAKELTEIITGSDDQSKITKPKVKHLLQVLVEDVGLKKIRENVLNPLKDLKVVPYYGCQIVRPGGFDDPEQPKSLDNLLSSLGAEVLPFYRKTRCCGSSLIVSNEDLALKMVNELLSEAHQAGAQVIAVTCPICQLNLDAYQEKTNRRFGKNYNIPIIYFTQLMGVAFGIEPGKLGLGKGIVPSDQVLKSCV